MAGLDIKIVFYFWLSSADSSADSFSNFFFLGGVKWSKTYGLFFLVRLLLSYVFALISIFLFFLKPVHI